MAQVNASIGKELYKVEIKSPTGNLVIADEPLAGGGQDIGFSPKELLAAALAACTSATVRMYADRKGWDLTELKTEVVLEQDKIGNKTIINRKIEFMGHLSEEQKTRMIAVANACPIHHILSHPIEINTQEI